MRPADAELVVSLVHFFDTNLIVVNFLFQSVSVDAEHLCGFHLIAIVGAQGNFKKGSFNLLQNDIVKAIQLDLSVSLLLEKDLELTFHQLLEADCLKICNKKIV